MYRKKKAFTLIELLVVIAIIAILAAILFPVFAQAKLAAKQTTAISNIKQINLGILIYSNDFDDNRVPLVVQSYVPNGPVTNELDWRQVTVPYVKNTQMFSDPVNPAARFLGLHSDPVARTFYGWSPVTLPANMTFDRGYALTNIWTGNGYINYGAYSMTQPDSPATLLQTFETKIYDSNFGPFYNNNGGASNNGWQQNVDATDANNDGGISPAPVTGLQWTIGGDKWSNKAIAASFFDGHAKRLGFGAICGAMWDHQPAGSTTTDYFGTSAASNYGAWTDSMCPPPTQFD